MKPSKNVVKVDVFKNLFDEERNIFLEINEQCDVSRVKIIFEILQTSLTV